MGSRPAAILAALVTLFAMGAMAWPVLGDPLGTALGDPEAEGLSHLWGLWAGAEHLSSVGPFIRSDTVNAPARFVADLIDPVHLLVFWPVLSLSGGTAAGATLAWNLLPVLTVFLAGLGAWRLGHGLGLAPPARLVLVAACVAAPYLHGAQQLGRTEYLAGAWYVLHLSFLLPALAPRPTRAQVLGAVLTLVLLAHAGPIQALWIACLEVPIALWLCRGLAGWGARARALAWVGLPSLLLCIPWLATILQLSPWWLERTRNGPEHFAGMNQTPLPALLRWGETGFAGLPEVVPYPGLALMLLAALGAVLLPRRAGFWGALGLGLVLLSLGHMVTTGPGDAARYAPVYYLAHVVPLMAGIVNWSRLAILVSGPLAVAAAWGIHWICQRRPAWGLGAAMLATGLLMADGLSWAPRTPAATHFSTTIPGPLRKWADILPRGALLDLPLDAPQSPEGMAAMVAAEDRSLLWHMVLGRGTSEAPSPARSSAYDISALAQSLKASSPPDTHPCADSEAARLRHNGFAGVVLHSARMPKDHFARASRAIKRVWGPPSLETPGQIAWTLPLNAAVPEACPELADFE